VLQCPIGLRMVPTFRSSCHTRRTCDSCKNARASQV
jgi:hypothetical protein